MPKKYSKNRNKPAGSTTLGRFCKSGGGGGGTGFWEAAVDLESGGGSGESGDGFVGSGGFWGAVVDVESSSIWARERE